MRVRHRAASTLLALAALAYGGLFTANSLVRVRTFSADSMNYVDVARRIAAGDGLVQSTGGFNQPFYLSGDLDLPSAFTAQPPGYPLAIAFVSRFGIEAPDAALGVSALAYAAILVLVYLLAQRMGGPAAAAIALGAALLFVPLTHLGRAALSECLAVAVVLMFFLLLDRHLEETPDRGHRAAWHGLLTLVGLGLLAGAAFSVRYSLWPLPFVGVTALGLDHAYRSRGAARFYSSAAFAAGALGPVAAVLGRNLYVEGHLLPPAMPSVTTLPESLSHATTAVLGGWRSTELGNWPDAALLAVVLGLLGVVAVRTARDSGRSRHPAGSRLPLLICLWAVLYVAAVVWRSTQANFDPIGARLALPATVPLLAVLGALVAKAVSRLSGSAWFPAAVLVVCSGAAFVREVTLWSSGPDARALEFRSERQQWLRDHTGPDDLVIGGGTMDVPYLFPDRYAISYAGLPYTEVLTYPGLERIADRHCANTNRLLLVVRPTVQLGGTRSDEDPSDWLGPFIADARAGRHEPYPLLQPLANLSEARVYEVTCP
ncbi:MAG: hypothetical protein OYL92_03105 [Acidobacteriota bacterium]|nr:hypothetical protein [Acidobacteriota bacterium]MDE3263935.1 hypothetical protein [Acidobacteriota bacterium]